MRWRGISSGLVMLLLLGSVLILDINDDFSSVVEGKTLYVDDDLISENVTHKKTIQAAVDNASEGDTVFVYNGTYYENIVINKTLNLFGESRFDTKIDGMEKRGLYVFNANYVNISTFHFYNVTDGIHIESSYNCNLTNNGIFGLHGEDQLGRGDNGGNGIYIGNSSVTISKNSIYGGDGGTAKTEGIFLSSYGGNGGHGIYARNSSLNISENFIYGGNGGDAEAAFEWSWGGAGGYAVSILGSDLFLDNCIEIIGGDPGMGTHFLGYPGGAVYLGSSDAILTNSTLIGGNYAYAIISDNSTSFVQNCTLKGWVSKPMSLPYYNDNAFHLMRNSNTVGLNLDFNKSKVFFWDKEPILTIHWYLHVNTIDNLAQPVPYANVCIKDLQNSLPSQSYITDSMGYIRWLVQTEYMERDTNGDRIGERTYFTPHTITAWNETRLGIVQVNMNESKMVDIVLDSPNYEINLSKGWNLISLPLVQSDTSLTNVLSSISGNYNIVQWFNASDGKWHSTYDDLTDLDHTMGFWIHMKTDDTLIVIGDIPNSSSIQLYKGWNMVGNPKFCNWGIDYILNPIAGNYSAVQWYDAADKNDPWKQYHVDKPSEKNDLKSMTSGRGYWIKVEQDCVWDLSNF
jgi:hypothetical protein